MSQQLNKVNHAALDALRKQRIITNPRDLVLYTMLENHPSLNKPDDVVYVYEHVMDEFKFNRRINYTALKPIVIVNENIVAENIVEYDYAEENAMVDNQTYPDEYGPVNIVSHGYGSNHNGGYDSY